MKKLLLIAMLLLPFALFAQIDSADKKPKEQYCMVLATPKLFSNKVSISVDFGQENKLFSDQRLKDEAGKVMNFNSVIDALNYMAVQGWEFVNAYAVTVSNQSVYHYVLRRKVS